MKTKSQRIIWIRGAGEIGSATAVSLHKSGFRVILSEINPPLAIRRSVTFSDAIIDGDSSVVGISAKLQSIEQFLHYENNGVISVLIDNPHQILSLKPKIIIDARMIKSYDNDYRKWADHFIGFGPGFFAGQNCHSLIETMRGHDLGKIIDDGPPMKNTKIPGVVGGESKRRVLYAPSDGKLEWKVDFGDIVKADQLLGNIGESVEIRSPFRGMVRGLIHPAVPMVSGLKIADVDPRGEGIDFKNISDKARSLGRAAMEASLIYLNNNQ
ncbi:MAG: EF2563 family selenium-dependent molybdenum hydroxylase system protein [Candidatus Marinimicrobia bacterium]|nr:EF2563 family selenium-dependent molybdenum hydroxylase system protein [Candidatus Neomarinimicrobiota bacterium]